MCIGVYGTQMNFLFKSEIWCISGSNHRQRMLMLRHREAPFLPLGCSSTSSKAPPQQDHSLSPRVFSSLPWTPGIYFSLFCGSFTIFSLGFLFPSPQTLFSQHWLVGGVFCFFLLVILSLAANPLLREQDVGFTMWTQILGMVLVCSKWRASQTIEGEESLAPTDWTVEAASTCLALVGTYCPSDFL